MPIFAMASPTSCLDLLESFFSLDISWKYLALVTGDLEVGISIPG